MLMKRIARAFACIPFAVLAAGCLSGRPEAPSPISRFPGEVIEFAVVPPTWITPDGESGASYPADGKGVTAYVFPSLPFSGSAREPVTADIPDFFRGNTRFRDGDFVLASPSESDPPIKIHSVQAGTHIVIDIAADSMMQVLRLDWESFQRLQTSYLAWLHRRSFCWSFHCFSDGFESKLRDFWKSNVLKDASFSAFARSYLNKSNTPATIQYKDSWPMFATRIHPGQQLLITWGNQNFYPEFPNHGNAATVSSSYSRVTAGGATQVEIVNDHGIRLYPSQNCKMEGKEESGADPLSSTLLPYPTSFKQILGTWFVPVFNLFDLHSARLLSANETETDKPPRCPDESSKAPAYLFLLAPSHYVKPDTIDKMSQFETEGRLGSSVDQSEEYLLLTREFVIIACDRADIDDIRDEWGRMLDTAAGNSPGRGRCGNYVHGVFAGKTFVELRNHFSIDGRPAEDGVPNLATIGQAIGPSLGARMNLESPPGTRPLLEVWRIAPWDQDTPGARRLHIQFYTTKTNVLDQAIVLEGDDIHVLSISEMLR